MEYVFKRFITSLTFRFPMCTQMNNSNSWFENNFFYCLVYFFSRKYLIIKTAFINVQGRNFFGLTHEDNSFFVTLYLKSNRQYKNQMPWSDFEQYSKLSQTKSLPELMIHIEKSRTLEYREKFTSLNCCMDIYSQVKINITTHSNGSSCQYHKIASDLRFV